MTDGTHPQVTKARRTLPSYVRTALGIVFSFETSLTVAHYAAVGNRFIPYFASVAMAVNLGWGIALLMGRKRGVRRSDLLWIGLYLAFLAYAWLSLAWSPSRDYALYKLIRMSTVILWLIVATTLIVASDPRRVRRFLWLQVLVALPLSLDVFLVYQSTAARNTDYMNYIGLGRAIGVGFLLAVAGVTLGRRSWQGRLVYAVLAGWFSTLLMVIGARGALVSSLLTALVPLLAGLRMPQAGRAVITRSFLRSLGLIVASAALLAAIVWQSGYELWSVRRMALLLDQGADTSAAGRVERYQISLQAWGESTLVGHGIGVFPTLFGVGDQRDYPHNTVLELLVELGLVGALLFALWVVQAFRHWWHGMHRGDRALRVTLLMLTLYALATSALSGDLSSNRLVYVALGLMHLRGDRADGEGQGTPHSDTRFRAPHRG